MDSRPSGQMLKSAIVLQLMAETNKTISQLVSEIGGYVMYKCKLAVDLDQIGQILESAKKTFTEAELDTTDGYRFVFKNGDWIHARASNTEPVIRIIVEVKDKPTAHEYLKIIKTRAHIN